MLAVAACAVRPRLRLGLAGTALIQPWPAWVRGTPSELLSGQLAWAVVVFKVVPKQMK